MTPHFRNEKSHRDLPLQIEEIKEAYKESFGTSFESVIGSSLLSPNQIYLKIDESLIETTYKVL